MKRSVAGFVLMGLLLVSGLLSSRWMVRSNTPMGERMEQAAAYALRGDWAKANSLVRQVQVQWEEGWHLTACFADHGPMEEIDGLLAQLEAFSAESERAAFAAVCMELSRDMEAIGDAHELTWWNLM